MHLSSIKGIVFDLDGTLVNTEPLHMEAWKEVLKPFGINMSEDWFEPFIGLPEKFLAESAIDQYDLPVNSEDLQIKKRTSYHATARIRATLFPGVKEGLEILKKQYPMAIATSSSDEDAASVFEATKVNEYFRTVITADMVENMKPAPDCYLQATGMLKLRPLDCVAVEDSVAGVKAAKTAGLFTIAVTTSKAAKDLTHADLIVADASEAIEKIMAAKKTA